MNLKSVSDSELLKATKLLACEEKKIGIEVLHHLREIDARKLFASLGFSSLFLYCTQELKYSEGGAYRRIAAMRLLRDVPEYEEKLQCGAVSVATLSQVQSFLVQEKRQQKKTDSKEEKLELLEKVEGMSSQQTERVLATISPQAVRPEKARAINEEETEIRFTVHRELMQKIEKLQDLMGHQGRTQTYAGLFEELVNMGLNKLEPNQRFNRKKESAKKSFKKWDAKSNQEPIQESAINHPAFSGTLSCNADIRLKKEDSLPPVEVVTPDQANRTIPVAIKRAVWFRDQGRCTFVNSTSLLPWGRRCESRHALQMEHILPFAKGGESSLENLRLLCPAHNQFMAVQAYGLSKMQKHWKV
jgi:hypothetical protein